VKNIHELQSASDFFLPSIFTEDEDENMTNLQNNNTEDVDLEALEHQVNQMRESLRASENQVPHQVNLTNGHSEPGRIGLRRPMRRGDSGETDTDDDELHMRVGNYASRNQVRDRSLFM